MLSGSRSSSRIVLRGGVILAVIGLLSAVALLASRPRAVTVSTAAPDQSLRADYHLTPPGGWLSDPQRPLYVNGKYNVYYLHSTQDNGPGGWEHATTADTAVFSDVGTALPLSSNFPVWTGSTVLDTANTAGFGANAVVALATQPTDGDSYQQSQYLWYSTDGGTTFTKYGAPVIANPSGTNWFRDPKITWDAAHSDWVAVIGEQQTWTFYTSPDLKTWTHQSTFSYTSPNIGGVECPDLFEIQAGDGTWHWVLGGSMQGDYSGKPDTYAYFTGSWDGTTFTPDSTTPQWLDWGSDWYAAVTWADAAAPNTTRYAMGWMNNWQYAPHTVPTDASDGYNSQMSVIRQLTLAHQADGSYALLSSPTPALANIVTSTVNPANVTVNGTVPLDYHGSAYELDADVSWTSLTNVGVTVGESADGSRYTNIGDYAGNLYVDRSATDSVTHLFNGHEQTQAPLPSGTTSLHLRILVDKSSVEVYTDDGKTVLSNMVYFQPGDDGITLFTSGGYATFSNLAIKQFQNINQAATAASPYAAFEGSGYGSWTTTGTAFGTGPASGAFTGQQPVSGYIGSGLVNSYLGGDSSTGTLTSPNFTITDPFINFLIGGGDNPRPPDLLADFEGSTWGSGWTSTGSYTGQGPTAESLTGQVGAKVLDTYAGGGDSSTGQITSPTFTITRGYIDFMLAGGNHPWGAAGATAVNLYVDGHLERTATGNNSSTMSEINWDVHSLIGHQAQIEVVDHSTSSSWGHIMVDQILFADTANATASSTNTETSIDLIVGGQVVRTATGQDSEHLTWDSWDVTDLAGQTAHLQIVDNNTASWGHVDVDQVSFDNLPAS